MYVSLSGYKKYRNLLMFLRFYYAPGRTVQRSSLSYLSIDNSRSKLPFTMNWHWWKFLEMTKHLKQSWLMLCYSSPLSFSIPSLISWMFIYALSRQIILRTFELRTFLLNCNRIDGSKITQTFYVNGSLFLDCPKCSKDAILCP